MIEPGLGFKRQVLRLLQRDRLADLAAFFAVDVSDGRSIEAHARALAKARIPFGDILGKFYRVELQGVCVMLGIDAGGTKSSAFVARILSAGTAEEGAPEPSVPTVTVLSPVSVTVPPPTTIFIGHGRSAVWRELKDLLSESLGLSWQEFNREPIAGMSVVERLETLLEKVGFAFLILTAEDEHADNSMHARENVIHEAGLFQGKLGFRRAILLVEEGCAEFTNISGLQTIRFPRGDIMAKSEEIRRVLKREGIVAT
jgi:hypothetical protein